MGTFVISETLKSSKTSRELICQLEGPGKGSVEEFESIWHDLQAVPRKLEIPEQLGAQQAAHIRAVGIHPAFLELPAHCGAADPRIALENENLEPGTGEIGGIGQAVVARADDDGVVVTGVCHVRSRSTRAVRRAPRTEACQPVARTDAPA